MKETEKKDRDPLLFPAPFTSQEKESKEKAAKELEAKKDEAYKKAIAACDEYLKLCGVELEFNDHGYKVRYHNEGKADEIFEDILNAWFN